METNITSVMVVKISICDISSDSSITHSEFQGERKEYKTCYFQNSTSLYL